MQGTLNLEGDFRKTQKFTWLADIPDNTDLELVYVQLLLSPI